MIDRRTFLKRGVTGAVGAAGVLTLPFPSGSDSEPLASSVGLETALRESPFVYVSPLRSDGEESACHAEVWYAWIDGAVVVTVASDRWKARARPGQGLGRRPRSLERAAWPQRGFSEGPGLRRSCRKTLGRRPVGATPRRIRSKVSGFDRSLARPDEVGERRPLPRSHPL